MPAGSVRNAYMTLQRAGATVAQHLPCRVDYVNIPIELEVMHTIPVDYYNIHILNRTTVIPQRSDYLLDENTNIKYEVYGNPRVYTNHIETRCTQYLPITP